MKRKASAIEEPMAACDWSRCDSSAASTTSPDSVKPSSNQWAIPAVPYFNSRTLKRYRDHRPQEKTIHQKTLAKLYGAQKQLQQEEAAEQRRAQQVGSFLMSLDMPETAPLPQEEDMSNQRNLNAFFGGGGATARNSNTPAIHTTAPSTRPEHNTALCEDCSAPLHQAADEDAMITDTMNDGYSCAQCTRMVCDMCAVRGDSRICLECAVPGGA